VDQGRGSEGLDELVAAYLTSASELPIVFPKLMKAARRPKLGMDLEARSGRSLSSPFSLKEVVARWFFT
jgi:hypothetical protein